MKRRQSAVQFLALLLALCLLAGCGKARPVEDGRTEETIAAGENESAPTEVPWVRVRLEGGTGRVTVASPAQLFDREGQLFAVICWSSPNYDYMLLDGVRYEPVNEGGNSVFELPLPATACSLAVQADTVAMSTPHLIDYTLHFEPMTGTEEQELPEDGEPADGEGTLPVPAPAELAGLTRTGAMPLQYAERFTVDTYEGGYALLTIAGQERYFLVPEGGTLPNGLPQDMTVLQLPMDNIYLVSSAAMDMFAACDAVDALRFSALKPGDWYVEEAVAAMNSGALVYAGKYSAPDYELLRAGECRLAVENGMITHSPEVIEQLQLLGIPVLIERSSYEESPQGRMEWIRLWGLLTGNLEEAEQALARQLTQFEELTSGEGNGKTVAFFYVTSNGTVSVRNANDYIAKMIALAGGRYLFDTLGTDLTASTSRIQMEEFYAAAQEADFLIYNGTIVGELANLQDFLRLCPLFAGLRAVQEGHVYCTERNLYQSSMGLGDFTADLVHMLREDGGQMQYLRALQ